MKKLIKKRSRLLILIITLLIVILSVIFSLRVDTNYDMTEYLPNNSQTKEGLDVLEDTFGNHAMVELMIKDKSLNENYQFKQELLEIDGILNIVWLDDFTDISDPDSISQDLINQYYRNGHALMTVIFVEDGYALEVEEAIESIKVVLDGEDYYLRGEALNNIEARNIAEDEVLTIILIIIPICFIILIFASMSWLEPLLVLTVLGIGVVVNLGTNAFLPSVSFITLTIAAALQLAISLDYSLFFIHRYYEFKDQGLDTKTSVNKAFKKSLPVISASALTTMVGFLALLFMRYRIGMDIGIVLSKGILFSYLSVILFLPVMIVTFNKWLEKLRHKHFMFHLGGFKKFAIKFRYIFTVLIALLLIGGIYLQSKTDYLFGSNEYAGEESRVAIDGEIISQTYGDYQSITLLLKDSNQASEVNLIQSLMTLDHVIKVDAMYTRVDPSIPEAFLPPELINAYNQGGYARMTVYTDLVEENESLYDFSDRLNEVVDSEYEEFYLLGSIPATTEIRDTVLADTPIVMVVSIVLIGLVILVVFKNLLVPVLLLLVIQTAIWLNIGLLAMSGREIIYIGYLVVLALQLGATIDYAMLYASRYIEARNELTKAEALKQSLKRSSIPIMISGLVLASAGFIQMLYSDILVVGDIGLLIGRGALLSVIMVLFFLPSLLFVFDKYIIKKKS